MTPIEFFLPLALVVIIPLVLRSYRLPGPYSYWPVSREFRSYRRGKFNGSKVEVLYSDQRIDRFAPSSFWDSSTPSVAIYICLDKRAGKYWLWRLYRPTEPDPSLRELTPHEANELLQRKEQLLAELCPKQQRSLSPRPRAERSRTRNFWGD